MPMSKPQPNLSELPTGEAGSPERSRGSALSRLSWGWMIARTAFGYLVLGGACLWLTFLLPLLGLAPGARERKQLRAQSVIHAHIRGWFRLLHLLGILRIRSRGAERLRQPGILVVANHPTLLDALVLMSLMPQADCVVKQRYYEMFLLGGPARAAGYIPSRSGPEVVADCVERLERGRSLIIFPEGTRSPLGGLAPFQRGAAHIALRSGRGPLPVAITCNPATLYHGQPWWDVPERRFDLDLMVGEPLEVQNVVTPGRGRGRAARALTQAMRDYLERPASDVQA